MCVCVFCLKNRFKLGFFFYVCVLCFYDDTNLYVCDLCLFQRANIVKHLAVLGSLGSFGSCLG